MTGSERLAMVALTIVVAVLIVATLAYIRRWRIARPPIGVFDTTDVVVMSVLLVLLPFAYLHLPVAVTGALFGLVFLVALQFGLAPLLGGGRATVAAVLLVIGAVAAALPGGGRWEIVGVVLGDAIVLAGVVAICALWVQSGMRAAHVALFAAVLTVYDLLATALTDITAEFFERVRDLPVAPLVAATLGDPPVAIGLGDCLMLALWPAVATKAYGRPAGLAGGVIGVGLVAGVHVAFAAGAIHGPLPLLTLLGPLILLQYAWWRRRQPRERTTREWLLASASTP